MFTWPTLFSFWHHNDSVDDDVDVLPFQWHICSNYEDLCIWSVNFNLQVMHMNYHGNDMNYVLVHILEFDFVKPQFVVEYHMEHNKNICFTCLIHAWNL